MISFEYLPSNPDVQVQIFLPMVLHVGPEKLSAQPFGQIPLVLLHGCWLKHLPQTYPQSYPYVPSLQAKCRQNL